MVQSAEQMIAAAANTQYAMLVNSGTAALQLALEAVADPGSRVAIPAMTFAGTANAVIAAGMTPVVVDIGEDRLIDRDLIPEVDVVMPVHLYGAKAQTIGYNVPVVEDACQAIGHHISHGAFSLYGSKTLQCGEGGAVVTNSADTAEFVRLYRNQGMRSKYDHVGPGFNYRITDLQAAVLLGQLAVLPATLEQRKANADLLWELIQDLPVGMPDPFGHTWHQFVVETPNRDDIQQFMHTHGVETGIHYPVSLSELEWLEADECPNAELFARQCLSLPIHEHLSELDVETVAAIFRSAVEACVSV
jgi:dTDP-4-amino-4,6-dideoxygalactose transaminase